LFFSLGVMSQHTCADQSVHKDTGANFKKLTPVILSDDVQACVDFWIDLGMSPSMSIPGESNLDFAALSLGNVELMYQSQTLAEAQNPAVAQGAGRSILCIEVESLAAILESVSPEQIVVPLHTTDYGAQEIYLRDPAGNVIGFAQQSGAE
uniref:VOC family protein n=1 Tax=Congregibacter sp. TaxID=2744308 RepID=UPI003F6C3627